MAVLVLRRGGFGDTLLTLPLLRALRRAHPGEPIAFAGVREYGEVLLPSGAVDEVLSSEALELWAPERARAHLRRFERVVGDEPAVCDVVLEPRRVAPGVPFGLQLARQAGLEPHWPDDGWLSSPRVPGAGPVVLAPGSGGRAKCWPASHWLALAQALGEPPHVVVGPTEVERDDPRRWPWPHGAHFLADCTPVALVGHVRQARWFVGNDSGPTHLAACLGVPTVALFGPTDPQVWAPVGPHVHCLLAPSARLDQLTPTSVLRILHPVPNAHGSA